MTTHLPRSRVPLRQTSLRPLGHSCPAGVFVEVGEAGNKGKIMERATGIEPA